MGIGDSLYNIKWLLGGLLEKIVKKIKELWAVREIKIVVLIFAALAVLVPLVSVIVVKSYTADKKAEIEAPIVFEKIPLDQLFIPDEPDFLPGVIFEKDQRSAWTKDDLQNFWSPPSETNEEVWKDNISDSLDKLLENIP